MAWEGENKEVNVLLAQTVVLTNKPRSQGDTGPLCSSSPASFCKLVEALPHLSTTLVSPLLVVIQSLLHTSNPHSKSIVFVHQMQTMVSNSRFHTNNHPSQQPSTTTKTQALHSGKHIPVSSQHNTTGFMNVTQCQNINYSCHWLISSVCILGRVIFVSYSLSSSSAMFSPFRPQVDG